MTPAEFWELTPRETFMYITASVWRLTQQHRSDLWAAWHVAALTRGEKLPALRTVLDTIPAVRTRAQLMTPEQTVNYFDALGDSPPGV